MKLIFPLVILLVSFGKLAAQVTVTGKVTNDAGQPLARATVSVKGTSFRVQTDADGQFQIFIPEAGKAWVVEAGGRSQEFFLTKNEPIVLAMPPQKVKGQVLPFANRTVEGVVLDEATGSPLSGAIVKVAGTKFEVATGEGGKFQVFLPPGAQGFIVKLERRKAHFPLSAEAFFTLRLPLEKAMESADSLWLQTQIRQTGAVAEAGSEGFNQGHLTDPAQLVQGKIAGLSIARAGDNPNEPFAIRLRGIHSLTQNAAPLFVVDGFPESSLQAVEPLDIAKIRVLKDAAAAAKYGIRGNAGVIEIETKKPDGEGLRIDYQAYAGVETVKEFLPVADRERFLELGGIDELGETNWYDEITQSARQLASHLGIRGGKANTRYRLSLGYRQAEGTLLETGFYNLNARGQIAQSFFNNKLQINALLGANVRPARLGFPQVWGFAAEHNPTAPIRGSDALSSSFGGYFTRFQSKNPVALIAQNNRQALATAYVAQADVRWNLPAGFFLGTTLARQLEHENETTHYDEDSAFSSGYFGNGGADQGRLDRTNDLWTARLGQRLDVWKIGLDWQAGYSFQRMDSDLTMLVLDGFSRRPFSFEHLEDVELEPGAELETHVQTGDVHDLAAWFASAGLNYAGWFFLDASLRREGSSRLGDDQKWGQFYGVSAGVNVGKWLNARWLDYFKPRLGFGRTGGVPAEGYLSKRIVLISPRFWYGAQILGVDNPGMKWETKSERNFGLDFSFLKGRFFGALDIFRSTASDLLRRHDLRPDLGENPIHYYVWENTAEIKSKGTEWSLGAVIFEKRDFAWQVGVERWSASSTLEKLSESQKVDRDALFWQYGNGDVFFYQIEEGKPLGEIYAPKIENGDPDNISFSSVLVGNGLPKKLLGISSDFRYKNLDFSFLLRGAYGHSMVNANRFFYETPHVWWLNALLTEGFTEDRQSSNLYSEYYVEDASFTRLQYVTLGYRFQFANRRALKSLRLAVTAQNLFTLSKYQGLDPEARYELSAQALQPYLIQVETRMTDRPEIRSIGVDAPASWLPSRIWSLQVQASF